jgi:hypothetical protein
VSEPGPMSRLQQWRRVLDAEITRWSARSCEQLIELLRQPLAYEVEYDCKTFQVEVELLENTEAYVHVSLAVDDGVLPASIIPASRSFTCHKPPLTS